MGFPYSSWKGKSGAMQQEGAFCPICRSRECAHYAKLNAQIRLMQKKSIGREVFGESPPNIFVGNYGYPQVMAGPLVSAFEGDAALSDDPRGWYGKDYKEIIEYRSNLVRGKKLQHVRWQADRTAEQMQETVLSVKPVDLEVTFRKAPVFGMQFSLVSQPMGPSAEMEKMRVTGNPTIPRKVDSIIGEGLKAREAARELLERDFDLYYVQKLLSAGMLGRQENQKMVPTRWAITATDKMIADEHIGKIKEMKELNEFRIYSNEYMDNRFEILLLPGRWEFEQFEAWQEKSNWNYTHAPWQVAVEYEPFDGRSDYASTEAGGYYAGRLAVAEALATKINRQARAIVFREIYEGYTLPLGVWIPRETARKAFENEPKRFSSLVEAEEYLQRQLKVPHKTYKAKSTILQQRKLADF